MPGGEIKMVDLGTSCLTGNFDLYCIFVQLTFGSLLSAFLAVVLIIFLIGAISKMNMMTITYIITLFFAMYFTLWWGGIFAFIIFLLSAGWFIFGIINFLKKISH